MHTYKLPTASFCVTDTSYRDHVPNFKHFPGQCSNEANFCVVCQPALFFYLNASRHTNHWHTASTAHSEVPYKDSGIWTDQQADSCDI